MGDKNIKFCHQFENHQKHVNIIWKMRSRNGEDATRFEDLARLGIENFEGVYRNKITKIVHMTSFFLRYFPYEDNGRLMEEATKD